MATPDVYMQAKPPICKETQLLGQPIKRQKISFKKNPSNKRPKECNNENTFNGCGMCPRSYNSLDQNNATPRTNTAPAAAAAEGGASWVQQLLSCHCIVHKHIAATPLSLS
jgi:hypothetical protein